MGTCVPEVGSLYFMKLLRSSSLHSAHSTVASGWVLSRVFASNAAPSGGFSLLAASTLCAALPIYTPRAKVVHETSKPLLKLLMIRGSQIIIRRFARRR